jgi:hypothetical protein
MHSVSLVGNIHETFCKCVIRVPGAVADEAFVREFGRTNRQEKVTKYWLRQWEVYKLNPIQDAVRYQSEGKKNI